MTKNYLRTIEISLSYYLLAGWLGLEITWKRACKCALHAIASKLSKLLKTASYFDYKDIISVIESWSFIKYYRENMPIG